MSKPIPKQPYLHEIIKKVKRINADKSIDNATKQHKVIYLLESFTPETLNPKPF